jgi:hypothetical protein
MPIPEFKPRQIKMSNPVKRLLVVTYVRPSEIRLSTEVRDSDLVWFWK